ncbi:MAG TPA: gluconate 2-dehydrogenase subunit 3 family protein, partial [Thermoleophilia bacterium]|nr:gluconate 2-dehydrogenase subunit 3 family protein [Thermoleophilia bacterium]
DCLDEVAHWDEQTRRVVLARLRPPEPLRFFDEQAGAALAAFCDTVLAQDAEPRIPVLSFIDEKLAAGTLDGFQYAELPDDCTTWKLVARGLDEVAGGSFAACSPERRREIVDQFAEGELSGGVWDELSPGRAFSVVMRAVLGAFYSHPWAWNEIGFGGPAYPRGYSRLGIDLSEAWEGREAFAVDPAEDTTEREAG